MSLTYKYLKFLKANKDSCPSMNSEHIRLIDKALKHHKNGDMDEYWDKLEELSSCGIALPYYDSTHDHTAIKVPDSLLAVFNKIFSEFN